ncbi:ornithine decarboxylase 1-like [Culex quinquefasciatus]|uniref:ornithine decarboxylase 1-like n=1 Tax=Culex quinquefasciatus TaxID=7176 RepID=UPI0018E3146C|nr:ornithine decarboxylase 1-like [Culex quinquefasciatus]
MSVMDSLQDHIEIIPDEVTSNELIDRLVAQGPQEEPLHLIELDAVIKRHQDWIRHLPRVRPFYAIKSNNEPALVKTISLLGCGFDCASIAEIQRVQQLGADRERMIFAQPMKTVGSLKLARELNCLKLRTVFDSATELRKIQLYYPEAEVLIRTRFDSKNAKVNLGTKFGCDPDKEAYDLLKLAKNLDINVIGWCFHVGSDCSDAEAIKKGRENTDFASKLGFNFSYIDIGGGFLGDKQTSIKTYAGHINRALAEFFPEDITIIAEPGRYYCAAAVTLIVAVHGKRLHRNEENPKKIDKISYYFNDGIFGSFYNAKYRNQTLDPKIWKCDNPNEPKYPTTLFGPTCDPDDCFAKGIVLPELEISDFVVFENQGAYTSSQACRFNGFCLPKAVVFVRRSYW